MSPLCTFAGSLCVLTSYLPVLTSYLPHMRVYLASSLRHLWDLESSLCVLASHLYALAKIMSLMRTYVFVCNCKSLRARVRPYKVHEGSCQTVLAPGGPYKLFAHSSEYSKCCNLYIYIFSLCVHIEGPTCCFVILYKIIPSLQFSYRAY